MKLGVITDEVTQDIRKAVDFAVKHGLHGLELRSVDDMSIDMVPEKRINEIKNIIESHDLEVCNISSSFFKCSMDSEKEYDDNIEKLKRLMERAHILGCSTIRGFSFFTDGSFDERIGEIIDKFQLPLEMTEKEGIQLLLEPDPSVFTTNCKKLSKLIGLLNSRHIGAVYDPGNDIYDPDFEKPYPDGFNEIKDHIRHVHVKDAKLIDGKPESVKVGTGWVPFAEIFKALHSMGYDGYVVLETHYRPKLKIPEELLKKPGGSLFSYNGDLASEESMVELKKMLADYL